MAKYTLLMLLVQVVLSASNSYRIVVADFNIGSGHFSCDDSQGLGNFLCSRSAQSTKYGLLRLAEVGTQSVGTALHREPVNLQNVSLNITFSFEIQSSWPERGDGMTFVMFVDPSWVGVGDGCLGAFDVDGNQGTPTLAVEFDSEKNPDFDDPDDNHVGLDTHSIRSNKTRNLSDLGLSLINYLRHRLYVWIDYDHLISKLEIRVGSADVKPSEVFINYTVNLFQTLGNEAYVGFTAANVGAGVSTYTVYDMSLTTVRYSKADSSAMTPSFTAADGPKNDQGTQSLTEISAAGELKFFVVIVPAAVLGLEMLILGCLSLILLLRSKCQRGIRKLEHDQNSEYGSVLKYSYEELNLATNGFSDDNKVGLSSSGSGIVYHGTLSSTGQKLKVAVKKWRNIPTHEQEFTTELSIISQLRHRHIIQLIGWCKTECDLLLVYEFIANGSLYSALFEAAWTSAGTPFVLSWTHRFNIMCDIAAALQYLHHEGRQRVIHMDLKSTNILLDENYRAILGGFGLARTADCNKSRVITQVVGAYGYIQQQDEGPTAMKYNENNDISAFGVLVLEIACGRKALNPCCDPSYLQLTLVQWVRNESSNGSLLSVVDTRLRTSFDVQQMESVLKLGLLCTDPGPGKRPSSIEVCRILARLRRDEVNQ